MKLILFNTSTTKVQFNSKYKNKKNRFLTQKKSFH